MAEPVKVHILDREFLVACPEEEKAGLRQSAELLDRRMREIREAGKIIGIERIAVMAALNLTHEMLHAREQAGEAEALRERLATLSDRVAECLAAGDNGLSER